VEARAEAVAATARSLRQLGFTPDAIIGHHGWGELLSLPDVWPDAPILGYLEFFYRVRGADVNFDPEFPMRPEEFARVRAKNAVNLLALGLEREGQSPTEWQRSTYPDWAQPRIALLREGANLDLCRPDPGARRTALEVGGMRVAPEDKLVTYVARDLEPYRGFHVVMRALPRLLRARRDVKVVLVGGDGVSYGALPPRGTWRQQMLEEVGAALDTTRVVMPGRIEYDAYRRMLQRSDAHLYLTYPFVASWSLREALAMNRRQHPTQPHANLALSLNNLAGALQSQERYAEAEPLYREAIAINEIALGPDHPDIARSINTLATRERLLGSDHPDVARIRITLANLRTDQGRYDEAIVMYERALRFGSCRVRAECFERIVDRAYRDDFEIARPAVYFAHVLFRDQHGAHAGLTRGI